MEQEVPIELHLQPPPVVLSRRMSRAYSSIAGDIRKAQDTDDNSLGGWGKTELFSEVWEETGHPFHIA